MNILRSAAPVSVVLMSALTFSPRTLEADDVPDLAGQWAWTWKDQAGTEHRHVLEIEGEGSKLAARELFDDLDPVRVSDWKWDGKNVRFSVARGSKRSEYRGVLANSSTINGTVTVTLDGQTSEFVWKATRRPKKS